MDIRTGTGHWDPEKGGPVFEGLATGKGYNQELGRIDKVRYSHEAMIDLIVAEPRITQNELAAKFGYSVGWISRVMGSDAFQAALAQRRQEIADPFLIANMEERIQGLARQSIDVLVTKLEQSSDPNLAIKTAEMTIKAMGFGARDRMTAIQNNFVVAMPGKAASAEEWQRAYSAPGALQPTPALQTIEATPLHSMISLDPLVQPEPMKTAEELP